MSCTQFSYSKPALSASRIIENKSDYLSVIVSNSGVRARDKIVQLYMPVIFFTSNATSKRVERKRFKYIHLDTMQDYKVSLDIASDTLAYYYLDINWRVGAWCFYIDDCFIVAQG